MKALIGALALLLSSPAVAHTIKTPVPASSWSGYHWAHTLGVHPAPVIKVGDNTKSGWKQRISKALDQWQAGGSVQFQMVPGAGLADCGFVYGTIQICEGPYGPTGWVAYTDVKTAGTTIVMARIRLNTDYFTQASWKSEGHKQSIICEELGNALGLQDVDRTMGNANKGSCLDYTSHPEDAPSDLAPSAADLLALRTLLYP